MLPPPDQYQMIREIWENMGGLKADIRSLKSAINGDGRGGLLVRMDIVERSMTVWAKRHARQLRLAGVIAACSTAVGGVAGFIAAYSPGIAQAFFR